MAEFTPVDALALNNGRDGCLGGDNLLAYIFLFAMVFGGFGGFGFGNRGAQPAEQPVTESALCNAMNFNDLANSVGRLSDKEDLHMMQLGNGIANLGYEVMRNELGTQGTVKDGDYALSSQLADCCCKTQSGIQGVNYNIERQGCETRATVVEQTQKVLDAITGNRIAELEGRVSNLQMQNMLCGVVRYPSQTTYTAGANPYFGQQCCGYGAV